MKKRFGSCDGFTLVELIVVIAILGILAGVGTIGYSGYVKKANMAADKQLVSNVANAMQLYYYNDPTAAVGTSAVVLTEDGTSASNDFAAKAMTAAFGDNWQSNVLKYNGWGKGAAVAQETLAHFNGKATSGAGEGTNDFFLGQIFNGTAKPTFANEVDDLFKLIEETAVMVGGKMEGSSGATLVQEAAQYTTQDGATNEYSLATFANAWNSQAWSNAFFMGEDAGEYNGDVSQIGDENILKAAVANAAVLKARNTAVANYLSQQGYGQAYKIIAEHTFGTTIVPDDAYAKLRARDPALWYPVLSAVLGEEVTEDTYTDVVANNPQNSAKTMELMNALSAYSTPVNGYSPAMVDAAAYYAMMDTVKTVNPNPDDDTYWDEMAGAVSLYGSIARGDATLADLQSMYSGLSGITGADNAVVVTLMAKGSGVAVNVNPLSVLAE